MAKRKLVYIVSDVEKSLAFEWTAEHLKNRFDLFFLLLGEKKTPLMQFLDDSSIRYVVVATADYPSRLKQWFKVFSVLRKEKPAIVHIHLWRAMLLGLSAAWLLRVPMRIFTRHHATIHHVKYPSGLKWDKLCNYLATDIVAISKSIETILTVWEGAPPQKVHLIHHGFDLSYFRHATPERVQILRDRYALAEGTGPVIGVIARYTDWKGVDFVIEAFARVKAVYPSAVLVLANAHGDYAQQIKSALKQFAPDSYREIVFEQDLSALYRLFNVFVHVPISEHAEAFGQTYVEALAAGAVSIFTLSGVASEFISDGQNALVVPFRDGGAIADGVIRLLQDSALRGKLITNGQSSVMQFELKNMLDKLDALYG